MGITECHVDVLLVEDDELIRNILGEALDEAGLDTVRSPNAEAALELMAADAPRVMVTDINLGAGMDGLELGRAARQRFPDLPIVYISGRYAGVAGLRDDERFLPKPFSASALLRAIAEFERRPG
jgi:two-component system cell cycle sensor histidine kinase/response regulator CckA